MISNYLSKTVKATKQQEGKHLEAGVKSGVKAVVDSYIIQIHRLLQLY